MMNRKFTDEEQILRIWDVEDVKSLMNKRVFLQTADLREEELRTMWVQEPEHQKTASYGINADGQ